MQDADKFNSINNRPAVISEGADCVEGDASLPEPASDSGTDNEIPTGGNTQYRSLAMINTRTVVGVHAMPVVVEVHLANGLPGFSTVGLPEASVKESKDRVRGAIANSGFEFPVKRITVNLSPADIPKTGSRFDLPIAIGILAASKQIPTSNLHKFEFIGELALDGQVRKVAGVLPTALSCADEGRELIVPSTNSDEAGLADATNSWQASHLLDVCRHLTGEEELRTCKASVISRDVDIYPDLCDVKGQKLAKRALEIAASGGHSLLFIGPPGAGKSMLAMRLPGILPELNTQEALEAAAIRSVARGDFDISRWKQRPFRNPHHSASAVALVGGGSHPRPGEISLAHKGILFLDELTEFSRATLEQLREPLETGQINIARANQSAQYPAEFMLIAACNPCPCGYANDGTERCSCSVGKIESYRSKLSGPMLDRIDMHVHLARVTTRELQSSDSDGEQSATVKSRVQRTQSSQLARQKILNSRLQGKSLDLHCALDHEIRQFMELAGERLQLSARAYHRILKLARTIADMEQVDVIQKKHVSEAISFRSLDRR